MHRGGCKAWPSDICLKPIDATQYDQLKNLPERPPSFAKPGDPDPIGAMINTIEAVTDARRDRLGAGAGGRR